MNMYPNPSFLARCRQSLFILSKSLVSLAIVLPCCSARAQTTETAREKWSTYLGGSGDDQVLSMATDSFGHVYMAGRVTAGVLLGNDTSGRSGVTYQGHIGGGASDAFLAKFAPQGAMLWCTYFGGAGDDEGVGVVVTGMDGAYLVGTTTSTDSIATDTLSYQHTAGGGKDIFVARFAASGMLRGATWFGGAADEWATGAALDSTGKLLVCGAANGPGAFTGGIAPQQDWTAGEDGILLRFKNTTELLAGTYLGGPGDDGLVQVAALDSVGLIVLGNTNSTSGIATPSAYTSSLQGGEDAFLMKLDTGLVLLRGTYFGGSGDDQGMGLARLGDSIAVSGSTWSPQLYTTPGSFQPDNRGAGDGFLALLDAALNPSWCTFMGDSGADQLDAVTFDTKGRIYCAGTTSSYQLVPTATDSGSFLAGPKEVYLMRFDGPGSLGWSRFVGSLAQEEAHTLCVAGFTSIFLGGRTSSTQDFTINPHQSVFGGGAWDGFAKKMVQRISTPCTGICTCSGGGYVDVDPPSNIFQVCQGDSIQFVVYGGSLGFDAEWMW